MGDLKRRGNGGAGRERNGRKRGGGLLLWGREGRKGGEGEGNGEKMERGKGAEGIAMVPPTTDSFRRLCF